jgi:hypothetical protein
MICMMVPTMYQIARFPVFAEPVKELSGGNFIRAWRVLGACSRPTFCGTRGRTKIVDWGGPELAAASSWLDAN